MASPQTFPAFYFENYLDSTHKIDLIESVDTDHGIILNLIQIKSHEYTGEEIEANTGAHRQWVDGYMSDISSYERDFLAQPEDSPEFKLFLEKVQNMEDVFIDLLSGDIDVNKSSLYEILGLGSFPTTQRLWILDNYLPEIKNETEELLTQGSLDQEQYDQIIGVLDDLEQQLQKTKKAKENIRGVFEIHSLCAVDKKVVSDVTIFKAENRAEQKAIKVSGKN